MHCGKAYPTSLIPIWSMTQHLILLFIVSQCASVPRDPDNVRSFYWPVPHIHCYTKLAQFCGSSDRTETSQIFTKNSIFYINYCSIYGSWPPYMLFYTFYPTKMNKITLIISPDFSGKILFSHNFYFGMFGMTSKVNL